MAGRRASRDGTDLECDRCPANDFFFALSSRAGRMSSTELIRRVEGSAVLRANPACVAIGTGHLREVAQIDRVLELAR